MNAAEQAVLSGLGADAKLAIKALLQEIVDKDLPAIEAAEAAKLPVAYSPFVNVGFAALYPQVQKILDAKIAAI